MSSVSQVDHTVVTARIGLKNDWNGNMETIRLDVHVGLQRAQLFC